MARGLIQRLLASTWGLCLLACGATPPEDIADDCVSSVVQGDLIEFAAVGHEFGDSCPAGFEAAEEHARWVAEAWAGGAAESIHYRIFESRDHHCWPCGGNLACGYSSQLRSTRLPHRHELAHAARDTNCSSLLEEGWAMLYGDHDEVGDSAGDLRDAIASVEAEGRLAGEYYALAMRFVAYVIETHGMDALRQLCAVPTDTRSEFEDATRDILGMSFDAVLVEFDEYPTWSVGELRQDRACETGNATMVGPGSLTLSMDCTADGVEGKRGRSITSQALVDLPEHGIYQFEFDTSRVVDVEIRNCRRNGLGSIAHGRERLQPSSGEPAVYRQVLPTGVHVIRVTMDDTVDPGAVSSMDARVVLLPWP